MVCDCIGDSDSALIFFIAAHAARRMQTRAVSNIRTRMAQKIAEQGNLQFFMPADHHPIDYRDQVRCVTFPAVRRA